ncbi:o-succinylbenzoate synthase [Microlunatus elymi]|uniref:o-succinylbenzoate synthase n=1 Tax=Microlunatus elymi TaxID=2596828 RepID=A0A516Q107_9ACTN|nr:o-succinylbenzoate synthase [Microlunatus elymi]QDP97119.1 o-succinylbenzoate synthase [Microlunatus elymi]
MQVVSARMHRVRQSLVHEFRTSSHQKSYLEHILIELHDRDGAIGWGEIASPSGPFYCPETTDTCWTITEKYLLPGLIGTTWQHPAEAAGTWAKVRGNPFAKAGVDMAVWALWSLVEGVGLARALGGTRDRVVAGVSLGIEPTIDDLLEQVRRHTDAGYPRVKLKIAPGWDVEPVRAVRERFGDLDLHVDANGIYTDSEDHLAALTALDDCALTMIEQPFAPRDFASHARLQAKINTPVCLDESVETVDDLRTAIALDAIGVLNIKVSRMGGLTPALAAHDVAQQHDIAVWCGGMHEFGIGRAANVAISSLPGFTLPSDVSASAKYYARDVIIPEVIADHGVVIVPTAPGLGHQIDTDFIAENTLQSATVGR